jgi:hypothetical protein
MTPASDDLARRHPVWEALSYLFLDTELDDNDYRHVARAVVASGFTPAEVRRILWEEVFPVLEFNLRHPAGEWVGFRGEWLQALILGRGERQTADQQPGTAGAVRAAWAEVCWFLPEEFN